MPGNKIISIIWQWLEIKIIIYFWYKSVNVVGTVCLYNLFSLRDSTVEQTTHKNMKRQRQFKCIHTISLFLKFPDINYTKYENHANSLLTCITMTRCGPLTLFFCTTKAKLVTCLPWFPSYIFPVYMTYTFYTNLDAK